MRESKKCRDVNDKVKSILLTVQKPGRYVGGELNCIIKDEAFIRFAFCFPDLYEIGMSHLGIKILYELINSIEDVWCERVFAPWVDMQERMLEVDVPLFALESKDAITEFDFIGFTLQYELSYTNVLNMLSLARIPLMSKDRTKLGQIVIAGGPCSCNPEPLADFVDVFVIGEGEQVIIEILDLYRECKKNQASRESFLTSAAQIEGVYVPSLYDVSYNEDGTISKFIALKGAPSIIKKRMIRDLDKVFSPRSTVVPMIETVHDRAVVEIMRGCMRGCRFCQAGYIYRPKREKSITAVNSECYGICDETGYDEISLSSLSSSDHTCITGIIDELFEWTSDRRVSISLPSMRVDSFSPELMLKLKNVRKSGLTFAPEAGTQRLRDAINKNITQNDIINTSRIAFEGGWNKVKLYFMIGLPTETDIDVTGIASLGTNIVDEYYRINNKPNKRPVSVTLGVSTFVPKPFTPFQWEGQDSIDEMHRKQALIKESVRSRRITFNYHDANTSFLEGVFARGDRKLCKVLALAHEQGMRFDSWSECFDFHKWMRVFDQCEVDPSFYANRKRSFDEILPWDHIDCGVKKAFFVKECEKAYRSVTTLNCKQGCSDCGASEFKGGICIDRR